MAKKIPVIETFGPTIQGEGYMIGVRTAFIRFGLCDYKCTKCDSMHAVDPAQVKANAKWLTPPEILDEILKVTETRGHGLNTDWITFSGGNPCIHDLNELVSYIKGLDLVLGNLKIAVETQGTFAPDWLHRCEVVTCSPKSPGMGEKFEPEVFGQFVQKFQYHKGFNVKVVVFNQQDIEFLKMVSDQVLDINPALSDRIYASLGNPYPPGLVPAGMTDEELKLTLLNEYHQLAEDMLQDPQLSHVKFTPQLHVLVWANLQGV